MHSTSQTILSIIDGVSNYTLETLHEDLFSHETSGNEKLAKRSEIAREYNVHIRTVDNWMRLYPEISVKLGVGRARRIYPSRLKHALQAKYK
jgi:hypothetical protein